MRRYWCFLIMGALVALAGPASRADDAPRTAGDEIKLATEWLEGLSWREIGPANMGGRIVALAVAKGDPSTYWVASASGGLLKTVNNGVTFTHQFDREATVSIGDVCVAPSDPQIVWVGTGENNPRNSVSYGDGVYKSTDGGKTWTNMGLKESYQIGKILIHPTNPDIVYVGALGRLYGPNPERGLFKTTDGGKTWEKILFVDNQTGVIDMRMHPNEPDMLLVATYERRRDLYDVADPFKRWGAGAGLHRTTDGGKTFTKITEGLPTAKLGRIGLDWFPKDPNIVFAIIDSEKIGTGPAPKPSPSSNAYLGISGETQEDQVRLTRVIEDTPADKAGLKAGDIVTSFVGKPVHSYDDFIDLLHNQKPDDKVTLKIERAGQKLDVEVALGRRAAGESREPRGTDPAHPYGVSLGGQRENVQDRQGDDGFQTGGVYKSTDAGLTWTRINSLNPRPMYFSQIRVDPSDASRLYVLGISMYRSADGGKTFKPDGGKRVHADGHALWINPNDGRHMLHGCDGGVYVTYDRMDNWDHLNHVALGQFYHVALDTRRDYRVFGGLQDNGSWGGPSRSSTASGPINEDWIRIGGADGFKCQVDPDDPDQVYFTAQYGRMGRRHLRTGEVANIKPQVEKGQKVRFNWNTPFLLSHQNSKIFYAAGNRVYRSLNRGDDLRPISPEITATTQGSASALAESPIDPNLLYVGTDDGALWITRDGGREWTDLTNNLKLPGPRFVATIEPSRFEAGRAYLALDGHRSDDDDPLIFATEDYGQTWTTIRANLPRGSTRCLREDVKNPDLLYLGTEFGCWASLDRGRHWNSLNTTLPTVPVLEIAIHPTAGEVVAATHGRSLWILDAAPLRQATREVLDTPTHLYQPGAAIRWKTEPNRGSTNRRFVGQNPPTGAIINYHLNEKAKSISLKLLDHNGETVRTLKAGSTPGLHRVIWDLTRSPSRAKPSADKTDASPPPSSPARPPAGVPRPRPAAPGIYRVVLTVDGQEFTRNLRMEPDPSIPPSDLIAEDQDAPDSSEAEADLFEEHDEEPEPID